MPDWVKLRTRQPYLPMCVLQLRETDLPGTLTGAHAYTASSRAYARTHARMHVSVYAALCNRCRRRSSCTGTHVTCYDMLKVASMWQRF